MEHSPSEESSLGGMDIKTGSQDTPHTNTDTHVNNKETPVSNTNMSFSSTETSLYDRLCSHKYDLLLLSTISILAPSWDVYSDLILTLHLLISGEKYYAICLLMPQLLNTFLLSMLWMKLEPSRHRSWSWILLILQAWPQ